MTATREACECKADLFQERKVGGGSNAEERGSGYSSSIGSQLDTWAWESEEADILLNYIFQLSYPS